MVYPRRVETTDGLVQSQQIDSKFIEKLLHGIYASKIYSYYLHSKCSWCGNPSGRVHKVFGCVDKPQVKLEKACLYSDLKGKTKY